jgi:hypothetical protein
MTDTIKHISGMNVIEPGLKMLWGSGDSDLKQCQEVGRKIVEKVKMGSNQ